MIFSVENGTFGYGTEQNIIENVSFEVSKGQILSILGSNGIGKTTVLKCMMGFLKWRSGKSLLNGKDISELTTKDIWQKISYVPQTKTPPIAFTGLEMVLIGRSPHLGTFAQPTEFDIDVSRAALSEVGALYLQDRLCSHMSGGEYQLVLIARALAGNPSLMILDEPESGLDFRNQLIILDLLKRLSVERNISVILNTHYPRHAMQISDHTLMLNKGKRFFYGATKEIITEENMREAFDVNVVIDSVRVENRKYQNIIPISIVEATEHYSSLKPITSCMTALGELLGRSKTSDRL